MAQEIEEQPTYFKWVITTHDMLQGAMVSAVVTMPVRSKRIFRRSCGAYLERAES